MLDSQHIFLIEKNILPGWMGLLLFIFFHVSHLYVILQICPQWSSRVLVLSYWYYSVMWIQVPSNPPRKSSNTKGLGARLRNCTHFFINVFFLTIYSRTRFKLFLIQDSKFGYFKLFIHPKNSWVYWEYLQIFKWKKQGYPKFLILHQILL